MYEEGATLIIDRSPAFKDQPYGFVLRWGENLDKIAIKNPAQKDSKSARKDDATEKPQTVEPKTVIDPILGVVEQKVLEDRSGLTTSRKATTGMISAPLSYYGAYGIQNQELDATKDYKEYTLSCEFNSTQASLAIKPLQAFYIEGYIKFAEQKWFIESVSHAYREGGLRTSINAYIPIKGPRSSGTTESSATPKFPENTPENTSVPLATGYVSPLSGSPSIGDGVGYVPGHTNPFHGSVDFLVPCGTDVLSCNAGKVTKVISGLPNKADFSQPDGNCVYIQHSDGNVSQYLQLQSVLVSVGAEVKAGQKIGQVGTSGASTSCHLHFGLRKKNRQLKPSEVGISLNKPRAGQV